MPVSGARRPSRWWTVDGGGSGLPQRTTVLPGDVFGEEEFVVLPFGFFVDPETPVVVGDKGAVFGVGDFGFCGGLG